MASHKNPGKGSSSCKISRRNFLKVAGTVIVSAGVDGCASSKNGAPLTLNEQDLDPGLMPAKGYILVDEKKCQGCTSCMMACSLAHEGAVNLSLSRIQVMQDPFSPFPDDIALAQCRQCLEPACVEACPEGALTIDTSKGNIRIIDRAKCIGCKLCIEACPFEPAMPVWNSQAGYVLKCDLCDDTPFWEEKGGVSGKQACVSVCPLGAIKFSNNIPVQDGDRGYKVNLRGEPWAVMEYPTD